MKGRDAIGEAIFTKGTMNEKRMEEIRKNRLRLKKVSFFKKSQYIE
jgi:hypothetical protein